MIKTTLVACLLCATQLIYSQQTIPASGGEATGSGGTSSYSVGQLAYSTNTGSNGSITQGVQQSIELFTLSNPELTVLTLTAVTYPNPTTDYIVLALKNSNLTDLSYAMYDLQGRIVSKGIVQQENTAIAMQKLVTGVYVLKVNQNNQALKSFKIIKK
ncbi:T9SS type A sorting domain-containing protein [Psychroserpens burtonensis]|uniref:T9SS type A sorting domain-containing protein n=1 Tax=Psychroserpens burtonensis TaxID=49278 RepID=A0A5C7B636_9FLAO|nr:T9SS type A sorting domain-containing protein [Psychroserpens burtonensis]TXE15940.1 T9SS type A sorting domain-containing protein [Psychroserpens burtonensis]